MNNCRAKRGDRKCDQECNTYACDFDGNDCSLGINPWANCTAPIKCWSVFMNGKCDPDCNNAECLFDGRDCEKTLSPCNPTYDAYCQQHYANGYCDYGCNNAECNWDGLDCEKSPPELADGVISVIVLMDIGTFKKNLVAFLRDTSHQLRTTVRVKKDALGNDMIYSWNVTTKRFPDDDDYIRKHHIYNVQEAHSGVKIFLEIDNRKCTTLSTASSEHCFQTATAAAEFLAAKATKGTLSSSFPIYKVSGSEPNTIDTPTNARYVLLGILLVFCIGGGIGIIITTQRKRASGITWFPEGFLRTGSVTRRASRRRGPDGQEMRNLSKNAAAHAHAQHIGHNQPSSQWSDDDDAEMPQPKRMRTGLENGYASDHTVITDYEEATEPSSAAAAAASRHWTQHHLEAAGIRTPAMLTPPQVGDVNDVNARGPCGMTPIMVAAIRGGGMYNMFYN